MPYNSPGVMRWKFGDEMMERRRPSPLRWLAALLTGVVFWYLSLLIGVALTIPFGGSFEEIQGPPLAVFAIARTPLAALGIMLALRIVGLRLPDLGLKLEGWRGDLIPGLALGILLPALQFTVIIPNTGGNLRSDVIASRALIGEDIPGLLAAILVGWLVGGFAEELFFRGHLITTLRNLFGNRRWAVPAAVILSTLYFAQGHAYQGWVGMLDTGVTALIWAGLYLWRGRLTPGIISHGLNDMLLLIGLYLWY